MNGSDNWDDNQSAGEPKKYSFPNADRELGSTDPTELQNQTQINRNTINGGLARNTVKYSTVVEQSSVNKNKNEEESLETYKSDVARVLQRDNLSALQVAVAEQKKQQDRLLNEQVVKEQRSGSHILVISSCIFILTIIVIGYFFWQNKTGESPIQNLVDSTVNGIKGQNQNDQLGTTDRIKIDQKREIETDGMDSIRIKNEINKTRDGVLSANTIEEITLTTTPKNEKGEPLSPQKVTARTFLNLLQTHSSDQLARSLDANYTFGLYQPNNGRPIETFLIFNVNSYDNAFAGMYGWENYMIEDLVGIFDRKFPVETRPEISIVVTNIATSTGGAKSSSSTVEAVTTETTNDAEIENIYTNKVFVDKIYFNKDTRVLYDNEGRVRLLYTFADSKTLIIVSSETGLQEILSRLTTGKIVR